MTRMLQELKPSERAYVRRLQLVLLFIVGWLALFGLALNDYAAALSIPEESLGLFRRVMLSRVVIIVVASGAMAFVWKKGLNFAKISGILSIVTLSNLWFTFPLTFQPGLSDPSMAYIAILTGRLIPSLLLLSLYFDGENEPRRRNLMMLLSLR